jgi:hypothetical protein
MASAPAARTAARSLRLRMSSSSGIHPVSTGRTSLSDQYLERQPPRSGRPGQAVSAFSYLKTGRSIAPLRFTSFRYLKRVFAEIRLAQPLNVRRDTLLRHRPRIISRRGEGRDCISAFSKYRLLALAVKETAI